MNEILSNEDFQLMLEIIEEERQEFLYYQQEMEEL